MPQWTGPKGLVGGWGYVYARQEMYCPALPVTCDGKVLCLGQTLHVASPAAEDLPAQLSPSEALNPD